MNSPQPRGAFPDTRWSVVLEAALDGQSAGRGAIAELCQIYWYPVFAYLRNQGNSAEAAQDLTQGFFLHMLERGRFGRAERLKGTFRGFLIGCLKYFEANERDRVRTIKRGRDVRFLSFDGEEAEQRYVMDGHAVSGDAADREFDRSWARVVTRRALERVRARFVDDPNRYDRLQHFLHVREEPNSYEAAAREMNVPMSLVKSAVHRLRREYREAVRLEIAVTVSAPHEIDEEIRYLIGVLATD